MIRLMIADSHPIMVHGFTNELGAQPDLLVVAQAGSSSEAIKKVGRLKPDILIMDTELLKSEGSRILADIKRKRPGIKVILETLDNDYPAKIGDYSGHIDAYLPLCPSTVQTVDVIQRVSGGDKSPVLV